MPKGNEKDIQLVPSVERWYSPAQAAELLGISETNLKLMRMQRKGPRFKKHGDTDQARVAYAASDIAEYQKSVRTVETEISLETQKAS